MADFSRRHLGNDSAASLLFSLIRASDKITNPGGMTGRHVVCVGVSPLSPGGPSCLAGLGLLRFTLLGCFFR